MWLLDDWVDKEELHGTRGKDCEPLILPVSILNKKFKKRIHIYTNGETFSKINLIKF